MRGQSAAKAGPRRASSKEIRGPIDLDHLRKQTLGDSGLEMEVLRLFDEMASDQHGVAVSIGRENAGFGLTEASILSSGYSAAGSDVARVGLLGPLRMDYSGNMAAVRAVARYLSRLLGDQ